ncbi:MAG: hypothetical protein ACJ74H_08770 [Thermoanaerobaculia bacterium]
MRRLAIVLFSVCVATSAFAKDVYLSIGGSAGKFRTDARIFNPSYEKAIVITARYLPIGNSDNTNVTPKTITVEKRSMAIYDDVVQSLFGGGPALGAVRLTSDDDFVATQRIFADESDTPKNGTLGQFVPGLEVGSAIKKGVLVQLKQNSSGGKGTFRTNMGVVNPNAVPAVMTLKLYDRNNVLARSIPLTLVPFGVLGPSRIDGFFGNPAADLSNAWISYDSDQPIFLYASVLDNGSEDPTFIPASPDTGVEPVVAPMTTITIVAEDFRFIMTASGPLKAGAQVRFLLSKAPNSSSHGIRVTDSNFDTLVDVGLSSTPVERIVTLGAAGQYFYVCTNSLCDIRGSGHLEMTGDFTVTP